MSYNTVCPRPESCDAPRALMSVAPNLCCDETKSPGIYTHMTVPCPVLTVASWIQVSQEAGQVVWYSHLSRNFPQLIVIHTVKGFGMVNKAEIDVFQELSCFSMIQRMLAIWSLVPLPFLKPAWTSGSSRFTYCWSLAWRILRITLLVCEMSTIVW